MSALSSALLAWATHALVAPTRPARLVLVRHGQSEWNLANRFTGWTDIDLTERGIDEARAAGKLCAAEGLNIDLVCTSLQRRAIRSTGLLLSAMDQCWVPLIKDVRLNEQHSGALTGHNKHRLAEKHGKEQVMRWRRDFSTAPPPSSNDDPLQQALVRDERYRGVRVPRAESQRDTQARVRSLWRETLEPALSEGQTVMVVAHGNTLRAVVSLLEQTSAADSYFLDIPTACPILYDFTPGTAEVRDTAYGTWSDSGVTRRGRFLVPDSLVRQAQEAMRQQVERDIAYATFSSKAIGAAASTNAGRATPDGTGAGAGAADADADADAGAGLMDISTCDAWTAPEASENRVLPVDVGGVGATYIRVRPPSSLRARAARSARERSLAQRELLLQRERLRSARVNTTTARPVACLLVLVRHGFSEYNAAKRFTGWADAELSERGREEARLAGAMLAEMGVRRVEQVYSSLLKRAIKTAWMLLDGMEAHWVPTQMHWRLNERHYGALTGLDKRDCSEIYGLRQVQQWRRGVDDRPPPADEHANAVFRHDRRYTGVTVPASESLNDCRERMLPFLREEILPAMHAAVDRRRAALAARLVCGEEQGQNAGEPQQPPTFVVVSSDNLIRAMVQELEGLSHDEIPLVDIPYATPLLYQFDAALTPLDTALAAAPLRKGWYVGDPQRVELVQREIRGEVGGRQAGAGGADGAEEEAPRPPGSSDEGDDPGVCIVEGETYQEATWVCE